MATLSLSLVLLDRIASTERAKLCRYQAIPRNINNPSSPTQEKPLQFVIITVTSRYINYGGFTIAFHFAQQPKAHRSRHAIPPACCCSCGSQSASSLRQPSPMAKKIAMPKLSPGQKLVMSHLKHSAPLSRSSNCPLVCGWTSAPLSRTSSVPPQGYDG